MAKSFPRHNLLAEPLNESRSARQYGLWIVTPVTHTHDLIKVTRQIYLQYLDCDLAPLVFTLPHLGKPAVIQGGIHSVVAKGDLH